MNKKNLIVFIAACFSGLTFSQNLRSDTPEPNASSISSVVYIEQKVEALLKQMTLEEKIGQMNQYNGFWDLTGPAPSSGDAAKKYEHLRKGYVGSMLNLRGVENVRKIQKIAGKIMPCSASNSNVFYFNRIIRILLSCLLFSLTIQSEFSWGYLTHIS